MNKMQEVIERAKKEIASWPAWKRAHAEQWKRDLAERYAQMEEQSKYCRHCGGYMGERRKCFPCYLE